MMKWRMVIKESRYRYWHTLFEALAVALAVAAVIASAGYLRAHRDTVDRILTDKQAEAAARMAELKDDMRKATLTLSFNLYIFPEKTSLKDWYLDDSPDQTMPEYYVQRLATSGIVTVRHFLPSIQRKIVWPEKERTIILIGTKGEVPNLFKSPKKPLVQPVPDGEITLGYELHRSLGLQTNDTVTLMGREFTVHACYEERGNKDDISAWIPLDTAQELLEKPDQISAILALGCLCAGPEGIGRIRKDIARILPDTKVIELGTKALSRFEARIKLNEDAAAALKEEERHLRALQAARESFLGMLVPAVVVICMSWIALMTWHNARHRALELSILRTVGFTARDLGLLLAGRLAIICLIGFAAGILLGAGGGMAVNRMFQVAGRSLAEGDSTLSAGVLVTALVTAAVTALAAGWFPMLFAVRRQPATVLQKEE